MKGFLLDKNYDEYLIHGKYNEICTELCKDKEFDNITIANPTDSNRIYIITSIYVESNNSEFNLLLGERTKQYYSRQHSEDFYIFPYEVCEEEKFIYINTITKNEDDNIDMLQKQCLILLPEGCVNIKVDKPIKEMKIKIYWEEELIH